MTIKLYDTDSHQQEFTAKVVGCFPAEPGYWLELDQTAFFAEGGGQMPDRGILGGQNVEDVQEKEERIFHRVAAPVEPGTELEGKIDWDFRFTNMQQHSGEHIVSGILFAWKGYHNVGFHMNETLTTVDFDGPLTEEELTELELRANRMVYENQPVSISYPSPEELKTLDYRSKKELTGRVRIVRLGSSDCAACCAPHVKYTGEVGLIKFVAAEHYKGGMRLTLLCGERALKDYQKKNTMLSGIAKRLSVRSDEVEAALMREEEEKVGLKEKTVLLSKALVEERLRSTPEGGSVCLVEPLLDAVAARQLVNGLAEKMSGHAAVLLPKDEGYQYLIGSRTEDVRPLAKALANQFGARGGGSDKLVQGSVTAEEEALITFLQQERVD